MASLIVFALNQYKVIDFRMYVKKMKYLIDPAADFWHIIILFILVAQLVSAA